MPKRKKLTPAQERERFIAAARELGCIDELPDCFADTVRKLADSPPMTNAEVQKRVRRSKKKPKGK